MKRKIICVLILCVLLLCAVFLASCGGNDADTPAEVTRMTVDINPSVEFMIDSENKVVSVTALNDDGAIIIVGEAFVGKTSEEAVEMMVNIACDTGYLVKGNVAADKNTVKISVSGNSEYAENLMNKVSEKANSVMTSLGINGKIEKVEALALEAVRALALSTSLYTEEEVNAMDEEQLYKVIAAGRVETAMLLNEEMRAAYYSSKEYKISFAESEETAKIIEEMSGIYAITHAAYKSALDMYSSSIAELDEFRYETLVSPESSYQKSLAALREAKVELLKQRSYTASLDIDGEEYASATVTLQACEENYNKLLTAYEALGTQINASMETMIASLRTAEAQLKELEDTLFDEKIEAKLAEKAAEIEANINAAKDSFFEKFEEAHSGDIAAIEEALAAKKQQLKTEIEAKPNN